jgi:hypothetical protein
MARETTSHDQLFKDLLRAFFREFMDLFFPNVAARLDFSSVTFLDKEVFTDVPKGRERRLDLVAQVQTHEGKRELVLIHVEVESQRKKSAFRKRMLQYYMTLRLRYNLPVFPIVVYLSHGAGGLGTEVCEESFLGARVLTFEYQRIGVSDLPAEEYLQSPHPLVYGLAALMEKGTRHAAELKVECLLRIARALIDEARKALLTNCVETYLRLDENEQALYEQLVPAHQEVRKMLTVYEINGMRKAALLQLRLKFGDLPEQVEERVQSMETEAELDNLLKAILNAQSLDDLGLTRKRKMTTRRRV